LPTNAMIGVKIVVTGGWLNTQYQINSFAPIYIHI